MSRLKAIVMDMDGTLLNEKNEIDELTLTTLIELEKQGVKLILASGRSYPRLLSYARQLKMDEYGGWLIEIDGVALYEMKEGKRTKFHEMTPEEIYDVFSYLTTQPAESQAVFDDGLFDFIPEDKLELKKQLRKELQLPEDYPWTAGPWSWLQDMRNGYPKIAYIQSAEQISRPVNKIQLMDEEKPLAELYERLQERFSDAFSIYRTTPRQLEILPLGFSKGKAVEDLMKKNGWSRDEVAVFGDGENDCSMFEASNLSFAMENARDYVQRKAAYLAGSNRSSGIVEGLKKINALPQKG